jgi:hypothetical protein
VRSRGALREADEVARLERVLAAGMAQRRPPGDDEEPLLVPVLVVVGEAADPGREVVDDAPIMVAPICGPRRANA